MKRYPKAKRLLGIVIEQGSLKRSRMISLFYARFAFADAFESVNVRDFGDKTVRGYSALIKLQLAYSAFETLLDVIDDYKSIVKISTKPYMHLIEKRTLANQIRANESLMKLLTTHTEGKLKIRVKHFVEDKSKNLMPIAIGIRHLTAHGILSAGGAELNLVSNRKLLDALSELLLEYSDDLLSQMTQKLDEHVELALSM